MYRRANIQVLVDRWDWKTFQKKDTVDITSYCKGYTWQKSIKSPESAANIEIVPQRDDFNVFDDLGIMDVIHIREFDKLKFLGYLRRTPYTGYISGDGKPYRYTSLICSSMGKLFSESSMGLGLGNVDTRAENATAFLDGAYQLQTDLYKAMQDGLTYKETVKTVIDSWLNLMNKIGAAAAVAHLKNYVDTDVALSGSDTPLVPRTLSVFNGTEQSINLWQVLTPILELPVNEAWFDVAPRSVYLGNDTSVDLKDDKMHLVFRETPFDGRVENKVTKTGLFAKVPSVKIQRGYLTRLDVARSMDEVYSVYDVVPSDFQFNQEIRYLAGQVVVDPEAISKYLLKMFMFQPYYARTSNFKDTSGADMADKVSDYSVDLANTFKNWYDKNDKFLSGAVTYQVPDEVTKTADGVQMDPRIGERLEMRDLVGSFYIEGVSHTWNADGSLTGSATVTRGYDQEGNAPMNISNKLFRLGLLSRIARRM